MTAKPTDKTPTVARILLTVSDPLKSAGWYKATLGVEPLEVQTDPPHVILDTRGCLLVLHRGRTKKCEDPSYVHFRVDDFDSAYAALKARGIGVSDVYSPVAGLRIVNFPDPEGNMLGIEG